MFQGRAIKDFNLWEPRNEESLEEKDVLHVFLEDVIGDGKKELFALEKLAVAEARVKIIDMLGDKPMNLFMPFRGNPFQMMGKVQRERLGQEFGEQSGTSIPVGQTCI